MPDFPFEEGADDFVEFRAFFPRRFDEPPEARRDFARATKRFVAAICAGVRFRAGRLRFRFVVIHGTLLLHPEPCAKEDSEAGYLSEDA